MFAVGTRRTIAGLTLALLGGALLAVALSGCGIDLREPVQRWSGIGTTTAHPIASTVTSGPPTAAETTTGARATTESAVAVVPATHTAAALRARIRDAGKAGFTTGPRRTEGLKVSIDESFRFQGKRYTVRFTVPRADLDWSEGRNLEIEVYPRESRAGQLKRFWTTVTLDPHQTALYDSLSESFRSIRRGARLGSDEYVELITAYIQQMPYDTAEAESQASNRYPVVTAFRGTGVCGDKSILLAGLLAHEGYRVSLLEFESETHMSVGIGTSGAGYRDTHLAFVETTGPGLVGEVGKAYGTDGTIVLRSTPLVVPIATEGTDYRAGDQVTAILDRRRDYERTYASLRARIDAAGKTLDHYDRAAVNRYNTMIRRFNRAATTINTIIDHLDDREALNAYLKSRGAP